MIEIDKEKFEKIKSFLFSNGRLLERKLFSHFFEGDSIKGCLDVLFGYQNEDGGFGNGIEPDLLCPDSTAIGAETAMYILELLEVKENRIKDKLIEWIVKNQNPEGFIIHPPKNLFKFPHQQWWNKSDNIRILVLAAILKKWGFKNNEFYKKVKNFYSAIEMPEKIQIYDYPYFVYLKYTKENSEDSKRYNEFLQQFPNFLQENRDHHPLFSRYWFYFNDTIKEQVLCQKAKLFIDSIQEDGGLKIPFENLPWWRPIFTLDGLIILKKLGFLKI